MTIKEVFQKSVEHDLWGLQILIMFLVYEKEVLSMDENESALDLYFLEKHHKRMSRELKAYQTKLQWEQKPCVWKVYTTERIDLYVYVKDNSQAQAFAKSLKYNPLAVEYVPDTDLFCINGANIEVKVLVKGVQVPHLIGVDNVKKYKSLWSR